MKDEVKSCNLFKQIFTIVDLSTQVYLKTILVNLFISSKQEKNPLINNMYRFQPFYEMILNKIDP